MCVKRFGITLLSKFSRHQRHLHRRNGHLQKVCYRNGVRYRTSGQKAERNLRTVELLLEKGGPELLAET